MPIQILMPALSPTMTEGNLVRWLKAEGDQVKAGQVLAEIETDKATMEVEAVDEGVLAKILVPAGSEGVKVNSLIALLLEEGEGASALENIVAAAPVVSQLQSQPTAAAAPASKAPAFTQTTERVFASPLARRLAAQNNVDLAVVSGSGPHGRVIKADIAAHLETIPARVPAVAPTTYGEAGYIDVPLNNMRKVIATRLSESKQTIPHFYLTVDCQIDALLSLRTDVNNRLEEGKLSVNDFIVRAVALSLIKVPAANSC